MDMPVEIVTIVNSSGKVISNAKQVVNVIKEAKAVYDEKKAAVKAERAIRRAQTYDDSVARRIDTETRHDGPKRIGDKPGRSSRSRAPSDADVALTRPPHAGTAPGDMAVGHPGLNRASTMPVPTKAPETDNHDIDMDLAYGDIPPDLEDRIDLDPEAVALAAAEEEKNARTLMEKIEDLLSEAQCLHHTATHIIEHLKGKPEAAAAVALALAELSALLGKLSPSFLSIVKCGSPAIFALLISPHFLIAAGLTVGMTVVMFGGWKIVKRIQDSEAAPAARTAPMAFEANPQEAAQPAKPKYDESEVGPGMDEALVVAEDLKSMTWRRGITSFGDDGPADIELISPKADRAVRKERRGDDADRAARKERRGEDGDRERSARTSHTLIPSRPAIFHRLHRSHTDEVDKAARERKNSRAQETEKTEKTTRERRSSRAHEDEKVVRDRRSARPHEEDKPTRERGNSRAYEDEKAVRDRRSVRPHEDEKVARDRGSTRPHEEDKPTRDRGNSRAYEEDKAARERRSVRPHEEEKVPREKGSSRSYEDEKASRDRGSSRAHEDEKAARERKSTRSHEEDKATRDKGNSRPYEDEKAARERRSTRSREEEKPPRDRGSSRLHDDDKAARERRSTRAQEEEKVVRDKGSSRSYEEEKAARRSSRPHEERARESGSHPSPRGEKTERASAKLHRSTRTEVKPVDEGRREREYASETVKPKKEGLFKSLLKKVKKRDEEERGASTHRSR